MLTLAPAARRWLDDIVPDSPLSRRCATMTLIQSLGAGVFLSSGAIFFVHALHLSLGQIGLGLSIAGFFGFGASVPAGRLADRIGARASLIIVWLVLTTAFAGYCFVSNIVSFTIVASMVAAAETAGSALRAVLVYSLIGGDAATKVRAQMRVIFNLGTLVGAAAAAPALEIGTKTAFRAVMLGSAALYLLCAIITASLPSAPRPDGRARGARRSATVLSDPTFLLVTAACGLLELYQPILVIGLPLWITLHTQVPRALNSLLLATNGVLIVLLQVRVGRKAVGAEDSARLLRISGMLLGLACAAFALSGGRSLLLAIPLLLLGVTALSFGELTQSAGSWGLSYALPPPERMGEYQGAFGMSRGIQLLVGPVLITALMAGLGAWGWIVMLAGFIAVGSTVPLLVAIRQRRAQTMMTEARQP
jgi:MFS family permease